ncbi:DNA methyltransferase [Streptococcus oralis]|uniref:Type III restriction-modification system methylation subunit n=1 Tax=Streptococcus oralis TaxID=1303 RepID=A0A139QTG5_STROR|nr:site-specific DNA-methyltransferase [Streptococcus oralis]KXU05829.1 Type III restriction-modification system methylation subunit [Streptococcus oralis]
MKQELEQVLTKNPDFLVDGVLNKNKLAELARQYSPELLNQLMSNKTITNHFFSKLQDGVLVFKKDVFLQFLNNKEFLPDSFTAYKTKIGLGTADGNYLSENKEVVLNFPYKDCVLEGGQTKDDTKRQEVFFNEKLAPTEINRLLDAKVLTNFKRYDTDGEHEVEELKSTDNLIIKGNNLIALHSLKKRFGGKVKVIYIDPPYNTGSDSFGYNDSFNHSTWLTFMKNRLEVARELLSNDGVLFIQCDENEQAYLKVLTDEIFKRNNFLADIIWEKKTGSSDAINISITTEHILMYAKNINLVQLTTNPDSYDRNRYKHTDEYYEKRGPFYYDTLDRGGLSYSDSMNFGIEMPDGKILYPNKRREFINDGWTWKWGKEKIQWGLENGFCEFVHDKKLNDYSIRYKVYLKVDNEDNVMERSAPWKNLITGIMNTHASKEIKSLFSLKLFSTPKPEKLLQRIMQIATSESDLILDFFMGSATTQAVAHKMNRQYIGIEQMDYIEDVSVKRLKKVIDGEQGGISKDVNWNGGGSFVYCELKNDAQDFKNAILGATSTEILSELFEQAKKSSFLSYRVDPKKLKKQEFEELSLAEQKQVLLELVDNNNLYVNYSEIDDSDYGISEQEKKLNRQFYGEE